MIAQGYAMDLYCDFPDSDWRHQQRGQAQYNGETASDCRRQARKDGWVFDLKRRMVLCPDCKKLGRKLP